MCALAALSSAVPAAATGRCGDPSTRPWCDTSRSPDQRAALLLGALSQDEKVSLLGGNDFQGGINSGPDIHTGQSPAVDRVGLPSVYYSDGPLGPRQGPATAMPAPMGLAATWDPALASAAGAVVGNEARSKGNDAVFAPTVNIMRTPLGGRTFEAYGEDPHLVSRLTVQWIRGAQSQGVMATVKHFAANNQEGQDPSGQAGRPGSPLGAGTVGSRYIHDSVIDERTLHEVYLPQFESAVKEAGSAIVMCSYNRLNGAFACQNRQLLEDILRRDWGFAGYVLADYGAAHDTAGNLNGGLDFEPWPPWAYTPTQIDAALASGQASPATVDEHVRRILRTLFAFGFFDRPAYRNDDAQIDKAAHAATVQHIEESAATVLENRGILPLDAGRLHSVAVIGKPATSFVTGGGSGNVTPFDFANPLSAIRQRVGPGVSVSYDDGTDPARAAGIARGADVALVFAADYETEGSDRGCLSLECPDQGNQDGLIDQVAAAQPNTAVILETGGPVLTPWRDRIKGLVEAWYPGEQGGLALARVLFGDVDPGGRLPVTFPDREADIPTAGDPQKYPGVDNEVTYKEGVLVGYRWFDARGLTPAFPFGYGLSYTHFGFGRLQVGAPGHGGAQPVSVEVTNLGGRPGVAVPELYVGAPPGSPVAEPPWRLAAFARVPLAPGARRRVTLEVGARSRRFWDAATHGWRDLPGCLPVAVGASSRELALRARLCDRSASAPGRRRARCRRPTLRFRIHSLAGSPIVRVLVYVNGRRVRTVRARRITRVVVRRPGRTAFRLRLVDVSRAGRRRVTVRRYRACTKTRPGTRHPGGRRG